MEIVLTLKDPTEDCYDDLKTFLAKHAATVRLDNDWTPERAEQYYAALPTRAQNILREAAIHDGYVSADSLRDTESSSLRGHTASLKQVLERGARKGWWPTDMPAPIEPQGPGFGKVVGYRMPNALVSVFFAAVKRAGGAPTQNVNE
ncbi:MULTISPECIES: hypothetical protein [unclassified Streptomyces]|uniref:hypothetical protein n=1 Tax=unclassified Streptomyces TaxID=2593676 RepID=UPI0009A488A3|nr:hypothetical protein [Streptomyces sp. 3211]